MKLTTQLLVTLFITVSPLVFSQNIQVSQNGTHSINSPYIGNELCKVKLALIETLSKKAKCTEVDVSTYHTNWKLFKKGTFEISVSATCSKFSDINFTAKLSECEECNSQIDLELTDLNGSTSSIALELDEAKYQCQ